VPDDSPEAAETEEQPADAGAAENAQDAEEQDDVIRVTPTTAIEDSVLTLPVENGDSAADKAASEPKNEGQSVPHPSIAAGKGLVFLQEDELDSQAAAQEAHKEEDEFQMVEQPGDHEVSMGWVSGRVCADNTDGEQR
jgi:hypothetical protein